MGMGADTTTTSVYEPLEMRLAYQDPTFEQGYEAKEI